MLFWLLKAEVCMMNGIDCSKVTYRTVSAVCPPFLSVDTISFNFAAFICN